MVKAQLLLTAAAVAAVSAFSPNAPQTVRPTQSCEMNRLFSSGVKRMVDMILGHINDGELTALVAKKEMKLEFQRREKI